MRSFQWKLITLSFVFFRSSAINGSNFGSKQKECSHDERYETLDEQTMPANNDKAEKNS